MNPLDINLPPEAGAVGGAVGLLATIGALWVALRRGRSEEKIGVMRAAAEARHADTEERDSATRSLLELVESLRADIGRLREELNEERGMRVAAQREVHDLRDQVAGLRRDLLRCGFTAPSAAASAIMGDDAV